MLKKYTKQLRIIVPLLVVVVVTVGFMTNAGIGTLSAIGWFDVAILCPLGALTTMLASKLFVPQAAVSLVFGILFMIVAGRLFCAWICPIPLVQKVSGLFKKKKPKLLDDSSLESKSIALAAEEQARITETHVPLDASSAECVQTTITPPETTQDAVSETVSNQAADSALTDSLSANTSSKKPVNCTSECSSCASQREKVDARHFVLGGSLLSAAVFGFPVFCLICPIGLSFATIVLIIRLFSNGDVTLSIIIVPIILLAEVVFFKKWCHKLCPLSAFMSIFGKFNKTLKPQIDDSTCIETSRGVNCGLCGVACEEAINPRHPANGEREMNECTRCRACVDVCPTGAISIPFLPKKKASELIPDVHEPK